MRDVACGNAVAQCVGVGLEPLEEHRVADQRDLHRLGDAGDAVARMQGAQEVEVVQHRVGRREAAEKVLLAERVDAVLHADAGIVLRQHGGGNPDVAHAAMRGCRDEPDHVEQRPAAHRDHVRVPIDAEFAEALLEPRHERRIVLHLLARRHHFRGRDEFHRVAACACA